MAGEEPVSTPRNELLRLLEDIRIEAHVARQTQILQLVDAALDVVTLAANKRTNLLAGGIYCLHGHLLTERRASINFRGIVVCRDCNLDAQHAHRQKERTSRSMVTSHAGSTPDASD